MTRWPPGRILLLDDDQGLLLLAKRALSRSGNTILAATTVEEAREHVLHSSPDLLILDYQLDRGPTGLDFFRTLQSEGHRIPALMVSGYSDDARIIEALRAGISDVVPKSVNYLEYLPEAVERALEKIHLQREVFATARLREQETSYRLLANILPHLVWSAHSDGQMTFLSNRWLEYTGTRSAEHMGHGWLEAIHPEDRAHVQEAWRAIREQSIDHLNVEYRLRAAGGDYRWFHAQAATLPDDSSASGQWFGTSSDIEDRKTAEKERESILQSERLARSEAERAGRIKDDFVATLSHELRTPLNAIIGWSQFLMRDHGDVAKLEKGLDVIQRNAKLQAQMVDDLLDMSRILSGKLRLDVAQVDLAEVIDNTIASVQHAADAKDIQLTRVLSSAGVIQGDSSRLQQIVWNLLMNAIKFTPKSGEVMVMLKKINGEIEISVRDNGRGIKQEFLAHVFDRFRQEDSSTSRSVNGLGLGLSLTHQLVEMHGGRITAYSEGENLGATFTVTLPLAAMSHGARTAQYSVDILHDEQRPPLTGLHVLVVEDEADGRDLVQRLLEERGARVTAVGNADEALSAFSREAPEVILSDIGLPGQDGYELIRRIRELEAAHPEKDRVPAAALTALARSEDRRRALIAGFQTHISKPVDPIELIVVIASLAGRTGKAQEKSQL